MGKNREDFLLDIQDLSVVYNTEQGIVHALNGLNLRLNEGEALGLVGETGAGKTTMSLCLTRLLPSPTGSVTQGKIIFKNEDLLTLSSREMRRIRGGEIAVIFQDPMTCLNPVMTVVEQIAEMIGLHRRIGRRAALVEASEMLNIVGIRPERAKDYPHQFSGGMRQRVMIAIALSCNPALLIADEPTTALDVTIQAQVLSLIKELRRKYNTGLIMITHDLGIVADICDRVAVIYAGRLVESGVLEEIFKGPLHPYTRGLFAAIPDIFVEEKKPLNVIPGLMPDPISLPKGCSFHPRCPLKEEICQEQSPDWFELDRGHGVCCHIVRRTFS